MKYLANDNVWSKVSWMGTLTKTSFQSRLSNIHKMITEISETITVKGPITIAFINSKIRWVLELCSDVRKIDNTPSIILWVLFET